MENMASFPDLRPRRRSAKAESTAASRSRTPLLLAVSAALLLTASFAVSELATLRGAKAHDASAFLTRELGPPLDRASLVRRPARGVTVAIHRDGYRVTKEGTQVSLSSSLPGHAWQRYAHGVQRLTSLGHETILVDHDSAEELLTVNRHQGQHTWRWRLGTKLSPRATPNGYVGFFEGNRLASLEIEPVRILDARGRDVTPPRTRWSVVRRGRATWLELRLDDGSLATPYTIDPTINFRTAGTVATSASGTSISVSIPAGAVAQDLLLMQVAVASTTISSTPTGWNLVSQTNFANTAISQAVFWRKTQSGDPNTSVGVTIPNAAAVGVVTVYKGVDTQIATPIQQTAASVGSNNKNVTCPGLTTTAANEMAVCAGTIAVNGTWPASGGGWTQRVTGAQSTSISLGWYDQFAATLGTVIASNNFTNVATANARSIGNNFGLPVDTTAPVNGTIAITSVSPAGIAYVNGGTIYYRGNTAGQFQVRDPFTDLKSAPDSVNYPLVSSAGWTHANETVTTSPNFTSSNYQWSAGTTTPPTAAERTITERDAATNAATQVVPIVNDTTGPSGQTISLTGTAASPNYYKTNSVSFSLGDGSDGGAGLDTSTRTVTRESASLSGDSCGTFSADAGTYTSPDTAVSSGHCYRYTYTIKDNVGNTSTGVNVTAKVDGAAPSHGTIALTGVSPAGIAYINGGGTIYYRGSAAGQFKISDPATDSETAAASVNYPLVSSAGWTHANETVTTSPNFTSSNYQWSAGTTTPPTAAERTTTATDQATNTSTLAIPIVNDTTAPSVTAPTVSAGYYTSLSVPVTLNGGSDGGSGLASGSSTVQRDETTLTAGSCGSFGGSWTTITLAGGNDTGVQSGKCYEYREQLTDNVGNVGSSSASAVAKVDSGAPTNALTLSSVSPAGSALKNGNTIYYRGAETGGGTFKIHNTVSDAASGPVSSQTAPLGGTTAGWTHTASTVSTPAGGPFDSNDFTWTQGASSAPTEVVTASDGAGNTTASPTLTFTNDSNAPAAGALTVNGTAANGSGTTSYSTGGNFTIGTRTDYSETQNATESGLASSTLVRASATYSAPDSCGAFGSPSTITGNPDQNSLPTGCYKYTLTGTDTVGNTVSISTTVKVDTSDPSAPILAPTNATGGAYHPGSGTRVYFKPNAAGGGSFDLGASSTDSDTGIASYTFPAGAALGTNWSASGSGSSRTYSYTPTATTNGSQNVTATSNAGRTASSSFDLTADSNAPSGGALTANGTAANASGTTSYSTGGNFTIGTRTDYSETQNATESGLASSTLVRTSATYSAPDSCGAFGSPSTITGNPDQNSLPTGCYKYTLTGTDTVGNTVSISTTVKVDTSAPSTPTLSFGNVSGGAYYSGSGTQVFFRPDAANGAFDVTAASSDGDTGLASYTFPAGSALGTNWSGSGSGATRTYSFTGTATTNGSQNVSATNGAGETSGTGTFDVTVDSTAPGGGALTVNGLAATGATPASYDADGSFPIDSRSDYADAGGSGLASSTLVRTSATFSSPNTCGAFGSGTTIIGHPAQSGLTTGCYKYTLTGTDNVGNTVAVSTIVKVDTDSPNVSLTDPGTPVAATIGLSATASDDSTSIDQVVFERASAGGSTWTTIGTDTSAPFAANWDTTAVSDGLYDIRAVATDTVGNTGTSLVSNRRVDNTAPNTAIDTQPGDPSNDTAPSFGFSSSETGSTFECRVDGGSWNSCTSPRSLASLGAGSHIFDVRATDQAGNTDASPASYTWTVDLTPPNTTIDTNPSNPSGNTTPTFTFSSSESGSTFECRLDGGSWSTCTTPDTVSPALADGSHTFQVRATDPAGNTDGTPASYTWIVDTGPPNTTIDSSPADPSNDATPSFTFSSSESGSTFECRIDGGSWTSCSSPETVPPALSGGSHTFETRATDVAGNTDSTPASYTWTVDLAAPETTIDSGPGDPSNDTTPSFSFSSSETGSTFECRIDGGSWSSCSSPHSLASLSAGSHTFDVRATDQAGNSDASVASYTWTLDLTAPNTTIDTHPSDPSNGTTPSFTFSSSESGSTFDCRVDGGSWTTCSSPDSLSPALSAGSHTFDVRATDQAGNTDGTAASYTWSVDLTPPNTTIDTNPADPSNDSTPTFGFSSSETGSTYECRTDRGSWSSCSSPHTISPALSAGSHTFEARATDQAGNTDGTPASYTWTVDLTAPNTTIDTQPADPSNDTTPSFTFSSSESGSTYECQLDGGSWSSCSSPHTISPALPAGSHTFEARATDQAGNTDGTPASYTWTLDLTAPNTTIDTHPGNPSNDTTPSFTFSSSETGSTYECRTDGGGWNSCTTPHVLASLSSGSHTFDVRATDQAGNTDVTPAAYTWQIDTGAPTVTITDPTGYLNGSDPNNYVVTATTPDSDVTHVDFYECSNVSTACSTGSWIQFGTDNSTPYAATWSTPAFDGPKAIRALALDGAGNTGQNIRTIAIDRTGPSGVSVTYPNGYATGSYAITTGNGPDGDVNAATGTLERQTGTLTNDSCSGYGSFTAATSPDTLASGNCAKYRYSVADNAGNWSTATSTDETKSDTAAPTSGVDDPGTNLRQTVVLTSTAGDAGGSSLASVAFQRRPSGGGSWTTIGADTTAPYSTAFDTTAVADGLYDLRTVATDVAGNVETSPTVVAGRSIDNTAPSATMLSPGDPVGATVTLTSSTSDTGGSGVATVAYELAPHGGSFNSQPASWDTTLGSDGLYDLRVVATDVAGNTHTSAAITTRVDNTPPAITFSSPSTGGVVSGTVTLTASATDASPASPPVTFAYKLHSDPPSAYAATPASWNTASLPAGDGLYDVRAVATDDAANQTTVEHTSIRVDNAAPTITVTAPAAAINGSVPSPTTFAANASDAGSGVAQVQFFECSNQSTDCATGVWSPLGTVAAPGPYGVSWAIPASDGNHALAAVATDNAGHPASAIRNVDVDRTAPATTILGKPADPSNGAPTFTFSSSETGSTFECSTDGGAFTPCTSPHAVLDLSDNSHTFQVRATDAAGNTDATPAAWTWHRDTNAPTGSLNSPGANIRQSVTLTSSETDPALDGYASGIASLDYEYSADGTTWASIGTLSTAPFDSIIWNTLGVTDGVYHLHLVIHDVAGNVTTSAEVPNVRIDNTPPTTSQDDPGPFLRATKSLTGSAADSGSGVDRVDFERAPTGSGSWTTIATDSTPLDGLQANFDTTSVADGHYDFRTVAYDVAGNQAASTPVSDRLVDNTPPDATLNDPGTYLRGAVNLTSTTSDPGGSDASGVASVAYEYSTNGGVTWQSTGATFNSASVPDGNVDLHVAATDAAGNSTTSATVTRLVDNTKPTTSDDAPGGWQSTPVTVNLSASDAGSGVNVTEYSVDGNPTYTAGTSVTVPAPADGSNDGAHTIAYFSADNAGNIETIKSTTVLIDATPPACPSCSAADYLRGTVNLSASPDAGGSGIQSVAFEYTTAGGSAWTTIGTDSSGPAPFTTSWDTTAVPDGHYDLRIVITDNAGNATTTSLSDKVVDNTAPDVALVGAPTEGQLVTGTVAITASAADATSPVASVKFYVRGSLLGTDTSAPYSLNWNTTSGPDGGATIQVVVEDMAGNTTTSAVRNVSVDNVSPTPTLADPGQSLSGVVSLSATSDPDTTQVDFERRPAGGGSWVTIASDTTTPWGTTLDTTALADGLYDFRAVATDQTGNTGTSAIRANVRIDNTAPAGSLTMPASGATVGGTSVALGGSYSDAGSGVASVRYELRPTGGGSWTTIASSSSAPFGATWDASTTASGSYDVRPVITDNADNVFTGALITIDVDATAPTVVLSNPGATISGRVTFLATVGGTGATKVVFSASPAGGASWTLLGTDTSSPWSVAYDTSKLADGLYDFRATVSDGLGNSSTDVVAGIRVDNTAPRLVSSIPAEGSTVAAASAIHLVTSEAATPVGVTLDGNATVAPVVSGTGIDYNTGALGVGAHVLGGELQDAAGKKTPFRVHFTVWSPTSGSPSPPVESNTTTSTSTTVTSSDGFASATMPAGAWSTSGSDWITLRITPVSAPSGLTNGFGAGPESVDVTARWALAGTEVHQFNQPVGILLRSTERGLVPATFENGRWRVLFRVPSAGTLPAGWDDGFWTDGSGFHLLTRHLSLFALLRDLAAPNPPQNVRGFLGSNGLTLRWEPGADNSGTYDFVTVFSDSTDAGHFGIDYTAASIGPWASGDSRVFRLRETDLAGNESELTRPLVPMPSLIGKTPEQAEELLGPLGLTVGTVTTGGTGPAGTITGPAGLVLAEQGTAIDLTVASGGALTRLVFKVVTAPVFRPAARRTIAARVSVTRAASVTAELFDPRHVKLYTWRFTVKAGRSIIKLRVPQQVRRSGVYSMRWTAHSGRETVSRRITIRLVGATQGATRASAQPVEVVLAGPATRGLAGKFSTRRPKLVSATGVEPTFDAAASRRTDVRVIVIDVDAFGVGLVRDLHTVFPSVHIVALASTPRLLAGSLVAGAAVALPRATPPATLARVIERLLAKPKPAPPAKRH
jgi:Bacterial Ig domain/Bacterial Ig-like domain